MKNKALTAALFLWVALSSCASSEEKLFSAVQKKDPELASRLLSSGADVNALDYQGAPLIHSVVTSESPEMLRVFLKAGVNLEAQNSRGLTSLHWAVFYGNLSESKTMIEMMIQAGASLTAETPSGIQPLHLAVSQGDETIIRLLLSHGAPINGRGRLGNGGTPLHTAAYLGKHELIPLLIQMGARVNALNYSRQTPLDLALIPFAARSRSDMFQMNDPHRDKDKTAFLLKKAGGKQGMEVPLEVRTLSYTAKPIPYSRLDYGFEVKFASLGSDFGRIAYIDEGQGETTLILIHGIARYAKYFQPQIEFFKSRMRVIALDLPGYGKSESPKKPWAGDLHAKALIRFMEHLNLNRVILAGHSYGSNVVLHALGKSKDRVTKAVFLTLPGVQQFSEADGKWFLEKFLPGLKAFTTPEEIIDYFDHTLTFQPNDLTEGFLKENLDLNLSGDFSKTLFTRNQVLLNGAAGNETEARIKIFKEVRIPMLILSGAQDRMIPSFQPAEGFRPRIEDYYDEIVSWNGYCRYELIDLCGHLLNLEQPEKVNQALLKFIEAK